MTRASVSCASGAVSSASSHSSRGDAAAIKLVADAGGTAALCAVMAHEHSGIGRVVQCADLLEIFRRRAGVVRLGALLHETARQLLF